MSDKTTKDAKPGEEGYVAPQPPAGYIPGAPESDLPTGQWVGEQGASDAKEVHPTPEEIRQAQLDALEAQEGGSGSAASPDTAAAGAEHKDR